MPLAVVEDMAIAEDMATVEELAASELDQLPHRSSVEFYGVSCE